MAKTKPDVDPSEKREEILGVARRLFMEAGYEATSMSRLAEQAGVSPNTIYWYFADKDALLVSVLDRLVADALRDFEHKKSAPLDDQVLWLLSVLDGAESLIATVHARVPVSEALRTWHDNFHRMLEALLLVELRARGVPSEHLSHAARVAVFVVEGLIAHKTPSKDRRALVRWLVSRVGDA